MASPYKQPKKLKELKGTLRPSRELPASMELAELSRIPAAPEDLPEAGKQAWYRVVKELESLKVLSVLDFDMLKTYCYQVSVMEEAATEMAKPNGKVTKVKYGNGTILQKSPWVGIYNDAASQVSRIAQQFGFSPAARTKISLAQNKKQEEKDPWDDL
jgi:P27 family predicted phage terminase small subunit